MKWPLSAIVLLPLVFAGCSRNAAKSDPLLYPSGTKAVVGPLVYTIVDTAMTPQIGDDLIRPRTAKDRFFLFRVRITNTSPDEEKVVSAMTLVDDNGQSYAELSDGTGVPDWLGMGRKVGPGRTEQGEVLFDAPKGHYRLQLTGDLDERQISVDVPIDSLREPLRVVSASPPL